jgi:hypothetical protein
MTKQEVLEQRVEAIQIPEAEKPLDVAGEKRIHPLAVKRGLLRLCQQCWQ